MGRPYFHPFGTFTPFPRSWHAQHASTRSLLGKMRPSLRNASPYRAVEENSRGTAGGISMIRQQLIARSPIARSPVAHSPVNQGLSLDERTSSVIMYVKYLRSLPLIPLFKSLRKPSPSLINPSSFCACYECEVDMMSKVHALRIIRFYLYYSDARGYHECHSASEARTFANQSRTFSMDSL